MTLRYQNFVKLIEKETGLPTSFFAATDYAGAIEAQVAGRVDLVFTGRSRMYWRRLVVQRLSRLVQRFLHQRQSLAITRMVLLKRRTHQSIRSKILRARKFAL